MADVDAEPGTTCETTEEPVMLRLFVCLFSSLALLVSAGCSRSDARQAAPAPAAAPTDDGSAADASRRAGDDLLAWPAASARP